MTTSPVTISNVQPTATKASKPAASEATRSAASPASAAAGGAKSSVRISAAALAALKEARETPAQTAAEARHGDPVAKKLEAKQAAQAAAFKASSTK